MSAREYYDKYKNTNVVQGTSSGATGKFIGSTTNPNAFASQDGYFSSDGGAVLADYGVPTITKTNIDGTYSGNSPLHEFFSKTGGNGKAYSSNENWYEKRLNPNSEGVGRTDSSLGYHGGIDINWDSGSADKELHATTGGTVDGITTSGSAGNSVKWLDKAGYLHWYMHMRDKPLVNEGDVVKPGQLLGYVGNTGDSGGAHLHYSIIDGSQFNGWSDSPGGVNPLMYFHNYNSAGPQTNPNARGGGLTFKIGRKSDAETVVDNALNSGKIENNDITTLYPPAIRDSLSMYNNNKSSITPITPTTTTTTTGTGVNKNNSTATTYTTAVDPNSNVSVPKYSKSGSVTKFFKNVSEKGLTGWDPVEYDDGSEPGVLAKLFPAAYANGDVSSSWYDALFNTNPPVASTTDVPPVDESKFNDDAGLNALQQYTNKYNIKADDSRTTDMLNKLGSMTFNVRAKRVEELLEILINKVDGAPTDQPLPNMFDDEIPDAVTRLSIG